MRDAGHPILITGVGKVNSASALGAALAVCRPSVVVNIGTAGALRDGLEGTHVIARVIQHDLDDDAIFALTGAHVGEPLDVEIPAWLAVERDRAVLATGDVFVSDPVVRDRLARHADLVDMEGYAVARTARMAQVPAILVKQVSDPADHSAAGTWADAVHVCATVLGAWVSTHLP